MATWYVSIEPLQEPFDLGLDEEKRTMYVFNAYAIKRPSATFLEELVSRLATQSITPVLATSKSTVPKGDGPFVSIRDTGGTGPLRTHNDGSSPAYQRPTVQIIARATDSAAARTKAYQVYNALISVRNMDL